MINSHNFLGFAYRTPLCYKRSSFLHLILAQTLHCHTAPQITRLNWKGSTKEHSSTLFRRKDSYKGNAALKISVKHSTSGRINEIVFVMDKHPETRRSFWSTGKTLLLSVLSLKFASWPVLLMSHFSGIWVCAQCSFFCMKLSFFFFLSFWEQA